MTSPPTTWTPSKAAAWLRPPGPNDHKYRRGVAGLYTGSTRFSGAAVLGVGAALRTGVGMVRYVGPRRCQDLVLARYPAALVVDGRADVWVIGSGLPILDPEDSGDIRVQWIADALQQDVPVVLDAGALEFASMAKHRGAPTILTPHAGELARWLDISSKELRSAPLIHARAAAEQTGAVVMLKGHTTYVVAPDGQALQTIAPTSWLATGGTGDALAGILGALLTIARHDLRSSQDVVEITATASVLHAEAAQHASLRMVHTEHDSLAGGPITVLDLIASLPVVIARWL